MSDSNLVRASTFGQGAHALSRISSPLSRSAVPSEPARERMRASASRATNRRRSRRALARSPSPRRRGDTDVRPVDTALRAPSRIAARTSHDPRGPPNARPPRHPRPPTSAPAGGTPEQPGRGRGRHTSLMEWVPAPGAVDEHGDHQRHLVPDRRGLRARPTGSTARTSRSAPARGRHPDHQRTARRGLGGRRAPGPGRAAPSRRHGHRPRDRQAVHDRPGGPTCPPPPAAPGRSAATPSLHATVAPTAPTAWPRSTSRPAPDRRLVRRASHGFNAAHVTAAGDSLLTFDDAQPSCRTVGPSPAATFDAVPGRPRLQGLGGRCSATTARSGR